MTIQHQNGSYAVEFVQPEAVRSALANANAVITDTYIASHYEDWLSGLTVLAVEPGERSKTVRVFSDLCSKLARERLSRKSTIVAFGGGVVGDLAGFVAAGYMRGIRYIQVPTSLLAQVDSSVGGKVGVDLPEGKNLVGAFWPPAEVLICPELLSTLPPREFQNGCAEVVKYGFIMDEGLLDLLGDGLTPQHPNLGAVIRRCVELKAQVVREDEFETTGRRAILNFGHTIGHAIELVLGYGLILHGEAISIGMVVEAKLGERLGVTSRGTAEIVQEVLERHHLPVTHPVLQETDALLEAMRSDKKAQDGNLAFSLLTRIGHCNLVPSVSEELVRETLLAS